MKIERIFMIFVGMLTFFLVTACSKSEEPIINVQFKISPISAEEYRVIGTKELNNPKQTDFQKINYKLRITNTNTIKNLKIHSYDDWKKALGDTDDIKRYWFGNIMEEERPTENSIEHKAKIIFYAKGLSEKELKAKFKNAHTTVSWTDKNNKKVNQQFQLSEIMEFKKTKY